MFSPDSQEFELIFEFYITGVLGLLTHWYQYRKDIPAKHVVALAQSLIADKVLNCKSNCNPSNFRLSYNS